VVVTSADRLLCSPEALTDATAKYQVPEDRFEITYVCIPTVLTLILFVIAVALAP
jgi:hypothetical protein